MMKIFLSGITGAMGRTIINTVDEDEVVAGFAGRMGEVDGLKVYGYLDEVVEDFDVIIDFSNKFCTRDVLNFALENKKPLVIATTGIEEDVVKMIEEASEDIPIVFSSNMSIGVNTIDIILEKLVGMLEGFDIEIIEKHHNQKVDSPSGTAKMFFNTIKRNRDVYPVYDRTDVHEKRKKEEVGISVIRGGTITGEHSVIFAGEDEVLEIKHSAGSKKIFAKGAILAARYLLNKDKGLYNMRDVLGVEK
ncbi:dihydrodipicolinate reductase [Peptoniphilus sp. ING2-D1G]|nr:dihydrodipicolinate reductase [Peptoniphilus sp. ING2-D1G]